MPDITMCKGGDCSLKESCYRFRAIPSEFRQSYFVTPPYQNGSCDYYEPELNMNNEAVKELFYAVQRGLHPSRAMKKFNEEMAKYEKLLEASWGYLCECCKSNPMVSEHDALCRAIRAFDEPGEK